MLTHASTARSRTESCKTRVTRLQVLARSRWSSEGKSRRFKLFRNNRGDTAGLKSLMIIDDTQPSQLTLPTCNKERVRESDHQ